MKHIYLPIENPSELLALKAGDAVLVSGHLYTARDAAHARLVRLISTQKPLPFEMKNQGIYYVGPCPAPPGHVIGSCGPTTSGRVDGYTPLLLDLGLKVMVGKGPRSDAVIKSMQQNGAVYLAAVGGAAALIASCVKDSEIIAFDDLGTEAVRRLTVENMPLLTAIDSFGGSLFKSGPKAYNTLTIKD